MIVADKLPFTMKEMGHLGSIVGKTLAKVEAARAEQRRLRGRARKPKAARCAVCKLTDGQHRVRGSACPWHPFSGPAKTHPDESEIGADEEPELPGVRAALRGS